MSDIIQLLTCRCRNKMAKGARGVALTWEDRSAVDYARVSCATIQMAQEYPDYDITIYQAGTTSGLTRTFIHMTRRRITN